MNNTNIKKNILWNTVGSIFYFACQWLITVLVVKWDSYESAGYLSIAMTTSSSFSVIALLSMRSFQISDLRGEFSAREYVGSRIDSSVASYVVCTVVSLFTSSIYQMLCINAFMLVKVAEALVDVLHGENQKQDRYDYIGKSFFLRGIATIVSFSIGIKTTHSLVITLFLMAFLNLFLAIYYDVKKTGGLLDIRPILFKKSIFKLILSCFPLAMFSFMLSVQNLIPKNVFQDMYGNYKLGVYSSIASPTLIVQVLSSVIFSPFLPLFSKIYQEERYEEFQKNMHKIYIGFIIMILSVMIGGMILGKIGLVILFGRNILKYYYLFYPIVIVTLLVSIIWILSSIMIAIREVKWLLVSMIIDFILCIIFVYPIIKKFESNGMSYVQILTYSIYIIFMLIFFEIKLDRKKREK